MVKLQPVGISRTTGAMRQVNVSEYCTVDGCYRETRLGAVTAYCEKHYQSIIRTGHLRPQKNVFDWVSDAAGPECRVCGRSVYEHGVTEFCQEMARHVA